MGTTQFPGILEDVVRKGIWRGWLVSRAPHKYFMKGEVAGAGSKMVQCPLLHPMPRLLYN